ncbi:ferric reductase-like transmembrane domain-containing protein [Nocardiopsis dassonvillei]|uniref:ferric reductase-like transmembrane domain-containing protein n=1 Tax=Nocardiopsis dassonvillei TaxID=2014 RepID=UPI00102CFF4A|nr:ferric reductase-like transmembrane domain-containing protein [Nocardiopsis dassonvillei]MCP3015633.1 ferric reductase-like transmembrane domain-containing protein [Nocardiopsis dassonvillei]
MAEPTGPAASPARGALRLDRRSLRADLRRLVPDTAAALAVTFALFVLLYSRIEAGTSQTLVVMPFLADAGEYWLYWLCQAFGWSGLLWAWITVMLGLLRSTAPLPGAPVSHARIERWHRVTSLTTIGLMFAHALAFFLELVRDNEHGLGWGGRLSSAFVDTFVPGGYSSGTGQVAILIGLIALYLAIPLGLAYYVRSWTGTRLWRALHRFVIVVYALSVWHTLLYGTNVWFDGWFRTAVWALQLPVALLLLARLLAPLRADERFTPGDLAGGRRLRGLARAGARLGVAAAVVVLLAVTVTGRDGGRTPGAESGEMLVTQSMVWGGLALLLTVVGAVVLALRGRPARE